MTAMAGSIAGQIRIDAAQAIAEYAALRAANAATMTALGSAAGVFTRVGVAALAGAAPIALLFKSAISNAAEFQKKMDYFGAITDATQDQLDAVAQKAIDMSETTIYSAQQMADAFVEFGKAGFGAQQIIGGLAEATANLAQAADISMAEASNMMASQLATFGYGAENAAHVADVLAGAANASIIDIQDMAYSLKYAGGIAATTGISFEDLSTAIALVGQRGIKGSTAGTALRQVMISLLGRTTQARKAMASLGLITEDGTTAFVNQDGTIKSLAESFQILQDAEKGMTEAQQLAVNRLIFDTRALPTVQILMREGAKGFADMWSEIEKTTAASVAHDRLDNLSGDLTRLKNNIQTMLIQVGGPLQDFFRKVVQGLTAMVQWFGNLSPTWQKVIIYGMGILGLFLLLTGILGLGIALVLRVIMVWKQVGMALKFVGGLIKSFLPLLRALGAALMANPWVALAVAIAAAVAALIYCWNHFEGFRNFVKMVWSKIQGFFVDAWNVIKSVFNWIVNAAQTAWRNFYKFWFEPQKKAVEGVINTFRSIYNAIAGVIPKILRFIKDHWKAIIAIILGPIGLVIDAVVTQWSAIRYALIRSFEAIKGALAAAWNAIVGVAKTIWNGLVEWFRLYWTVFTTIITTVWNGITAVLERIWGGIVQMATAIWGVLSTFFRNLWLGVTAIFTTAWSMISETLLAVWNAIKGPLENFWNGVSSFFENLWHGVVEIFNRAWDILKGALQAAVTYIVTPLKNAATLVWNAIQEIISRIWDAIIGVIQGVYNEFGKMYDNMLTLGKNIVVGLWNGIMSLADWLWKKVKGWMSGLWHGMLDFFGIKSPSRKGIFMGQMLMEGLAQGINGQKKLAVSAAEDANKAVLNAYSKTLDTSLNSDLTSTYSGLNALNRAAFGSLGATATTITNETKVFEFNTYNPQAEQSSESNARRIRTLASMGAF